MELLGLGRDDRHATGTRDGDAALVAEDQPRFATLADSARYHVEELERLKRHVGSGVHHQVADELARVLVTNPYLLHGMADGGVYLWVSPSAKRILGYEARQMIGRPFIEFVHPDDRAKTMALAHRMLSSDVPATFDNRILTADGSHRRMLWVASRYEEGRTFFLAIPVDSCPATACARRLGV